MRKRYWRAFVLGAALALPAFSGERVFSLEEAIATALKNNPGILVSEKAIEAARARTFQLGAFPNPELVFSDEGIHSRSVQGERELSLGLRQLIEFPGKRGLRKAIGLSGEKVSAAASESVRLQVTAQIKKAYWRAAYAEMALANLQSILETVREYQKLASIRFAAGQVASPDVLRGELEGVRVQNEIIEARRTLQQEKAALWLEMGVETPESYPPLEVMVFTPLAKGLEELKREAAERPSLRALRQELGLRETSILLAKKNFFPDLRLGFFYPSLNSRSWGFEVEISIPLWRQPLRGGVLEAEALRDQGIISLNSALRRIMNRVESSYADVRAASDQVALIETSLLKDAADLLSAGLTNYQYGKIDSLNLFDIYRLHRSAQFEHFRALLNYHLSLAELEAAGEEL